MPLGASFPGNAQGIDFVPGRGIYGAGLNGMLWLLDPQTLQFRFYWHRCFWNYRSCV